MKKHEEPIVVRLIVKGRGLDFDSTANVWQPDDTDMIEELLTTVRATVGVRRVIRAGTKGAA